MLVLDPRDWRGVPGLHTPQWPTMANKAVTAASTIGSREPQEGPGFSPNAPNFRAITVFK